MKGVAIAMETVIYLILAVTVLTVLLYFFTSQANPAQNRLELYRQQQDGCLAFAKQQKSCQEIDFPQKAQLEKTCRQLSEFQSCTTGGLNCLRECCRTFCGIA
ncbi:MAG: hypothetical protein HY513_05580 [Candidatus Aenigmarchaeota archaeon]|nr:hypothetical protein [Candidatus Aenigmarchaeota archaeon]